MKVIKQISPKQQFRFCTHVEYFKIFLSFIIIFLHFSGCRPKNSFVEYVNYVDDIENGLVQEITSGDIKLICSLKPAEYILIKEKFKEVLHKDSIKITQDEIKDMDHILFFKLDFLSKAKKDFLKSGIENEGEYFSRLQYLISDIKNDLVVKVGNDTINCLFSELERDFGLTQKVTLNLGFSNETTFPENKDLELMFNDKLFGTGIQIFKFDKSALANVPKFNKI